MAAPRCESRIQSLPFQYVIFWSFWFILSYLLVLALIPSSMPFPPLNSGRSTISVLHAVRRQGLVEDLLSQHSRVKDADQLCRITRGCDGTPGRCGLEGKEGSVPPWERRVNFSFTMHEGSRPFHEYVIDRVYLFLSFVWIMISYNQAI